MSTYPTPIIKTSNHVSLTKNQLTFDGDVGNAVGKIALQTSDAGNHVTTTRGSVRKKGITFTLSDRSVSPSSQEFSDYVMNWRPDDGCVILGRRNNDVATDVPSTSSAYATRFRIDRPAQHKALLRGALTSALFPCSASHKVKDEQSAVRRTGNCVLFVDSALVHMAIHLFILGFGMAKDISRLEDSDWYLYLAYAIIEVLLTVIYIIVSMAKLCLSLRAARAITDDLDYVVAGQSVSGRQLRVSLTASVCVGIGLLVFNCGSFVLLLCLSRLRWTPIVSNGSILLVNILYSKLSSIAHRVAWQRRVDQLKLVTYESALLLSEAAHVTTQEKEDTRTVSFDRAQFFLQSLRKTPAFEQRSYVKFFRDSQLTVMPVEQANVNKQSLFISTV